MGLISTSDAAYLAGLKLADEVWRAAWRPLGRSIRLRELVTKAAKNNCRNGVGPRFFFICLSNFPAGEGSDRGRSGAIPWPGARIS